MITEDKIIGKFNTKDFRCKHCKNLYISEELINKLQILGEALNFSKAKVISGYRCKDHPVELQNKNTGQHTKGLAVDIEYFDKNGNKLPAKIVICVAYELGLFKGLANVENASSEGEVHLDIRESGSYRGDETIDYKSHWQDPYSYYGVTKEEVKNYINSDYEPIKPEERNTSVNQVKVLVNALKIRKSPTTTSITYQNAEKDAIYNYEEVTENENYKWYKIGNNSWIADNGKYLEILPKLENNSASENDSKNQIEELQKEIEEYKNKVKNLENEIKELKTYKFKYTSKEDAKYLKTLKKGDILLIK